MAGRIEDARLAVPSDDTAPPATATGKGLKDARDALADQAQVIADKDCRKITDTKASRDCALYKTLLAGKPDFTPGSRNIERLASHIDEFIIATQVLARELRTQIGALVVPSAPTPCSATSPIYTQAAPLYISGDVGITLPLFINTSNSYGTDAVLHVAVSSR